MDTAGIHAAGIHEQLAELSELEEHVQTLADEISKRTRVFEDITQVTKARLPKTSEELKPPSRNVPSELVGLPNTMADPWRKACGKYLRDVSGRLATSIFLLQMSHFQAKERLKNMKLIFENSFSKDEVLSAAIGIYRDPLILRPRKPDMSMALIQARDILSLNDLRTKILSKTPSSPTTPDTSDEETTENEDTTSRDRQTAYHIWPLVNMAIVIRQATQQRTLPYEEQDQEVTDNAIQFSHLGSILQDLTRFRLQPPTDQDLRWFQFGYGILYSSPALRWYSATFHSALNFHYGVREMTEYEGDVKPPGTETRFYPNFGRFRDIVEVWCGRNLEDRKSDLEEYIMDNVFLKFLYEDMESFYVETAIPWYNQQRSRNSLQQEQQEGMDIGENVGSGPNSIEAGGNLQRQGRSVPRSFRELVAQHHELNTE